MLFLFKKSKCFQKFKISYFLVLTLKNKISQIWAVRSQYFTLAITISQSIKNLDSIMLENDHKCISQYILFWISAQDSCFKNSNIHAVDRPKGNALCAIFDFYLTISKSWLWASLAVQMVKNLPAMKEIQVWSLGLEDPLEKGMATHSSILVWRIPWT